MVIGYRIQLGREYSVVRGYCNRCHVEANSGDGVNLENSIARRFVESVVSVCKKRNGCGIDLLWRVFRTCSSACPSRLEPRQVLGEEAR